ncbi:MAG TPA: trehalase-like domain-containing protein, partial [Chthoniobacterales bacterium]
MSASSVVEQGQPRIQDYAIIGNGRSAALVSRAGSIDWLCWPRFDSGSIFAAILDPNVGGSWTIRTTADAEIERRYIDNTNVLETRFRTASGTIVLTDFMPVASEEEKRKRLWPEHEIIRSVKCEQGEVDLLVDFIPRPDYGRAAPKIRNAGKLGWKIDLDTAVLTLCSNMPLDGFKASSLRATSAGAGLSGRFTLQAGAAAEFSLSFSSEAPAVVPPLGELVETKLSLTID